MKCPLCNSPVSCDLKVGNLPKVDDVVAYRVGGISYDLYRVKAVLVGGLVLKGRMFERVLSHNDFLMDSPFIAGRVVRRKGFWGLVPREEIQWYNNEL